MIFILDKFFILIGDSLFKLLNLPNILYNFDFKIKRDSEGSESKTEKLTLLLKDKKIIGSLSIILLILFILLPVELFLIVIVMILILFFIVFYLPKWKLKRQYIDITSELPYALRHMATELKSGKGLHDSLNTISNGNYGSLSLEFKRVLEEVKYGTKTEDSLLSMSKRINSDGLTRAIHQIISTLRVGGNLANNLTVIAEDISFDMQIKLKEYTQKLNGFILIYTFLVILIPVVFLIMLMAASTVMGDLIPPVIIYILYIFMFPMVVVMLGVLIKSLEPRI